METRTILIILAYILGALGIFWLRTFPFREKKTKAPVQTARAKLVERRVQPGNPRRSGRTMMGYSFILTFLLEDGRKLELDSYEIEYGGLREGMEGMLTWQGTYFLGLEQQAA